MSATLGMLLDDARRRRFVGREREIESFSAALAGSRPHRVLFVHGRGGIGKTTLLDRLQLIAQEQGRTMVRFDAGDLTVTPDALEEALEPARSGSEDAVLMIDRYEHLEPLDRWLRTELLPSLPSSSVTVLAGRNPPDTAWMADPGWRELLVVHQLHEMDADDGADLLARAGVDPAIHERLLELSHGHPLALALLAGRASSGSVPEGLADAPDVVGALLPLFIDDVPDEDHALALELCSTAWVTTPALLQCAVRERSDSVWRWLEELPFIERSPHGLRPHDLARELLQAEHARRGTERQRQIHLIVHSWVSEAPDERAAGSEQAALGLLYLHRKNPQVVAFWQLQHTESITVAPARPSDHSAVLEVIERAEGPDEAAIAARWLAAQPERLRLVRNPAGVFGFAMDIVVPHDPGLEEGDPVVRAVLTEVARTSPLRPGESIDVGRFFGSSDRSAPYQADAYSAVAASVTSLISWLTTQRAWSWVTSMAPEFWTPIFEYLGFEHRIDIPGPGERVAFGIDWRRIGFDRWLEHMAIREVTGETGPLPPALLLPPPLSRVDFQQGVRDALRDLHDPVALADNRLLGARFLPDPGRAAPADLTAAVGRAVEQLAAVSRDEELARVLDRTFLHPAASQEAAAETLHLSFSTYRRRLAAAIERLTDTLWAAEIGEIHL